MEKISDKRASEPLPEKGLIKTSFVSSVGIPKKLKTGDKKFVKREVKPLVSKSSVNIKILTRQGKIFTANGIALEAPFVNASYGLTFFIRLYIRQNKISSGIK